MRGWSGRRDQVGGWGQRRVGGAEEAESRQQEAGRGDVDESERRRDRSDLYMTCGAGGHPEAKRHHLNRAL